MVNTNGIACSSSSPFDRYNNHFEYILCTICTVFCNFLCEKKFCFSFGVEFVQRSMQRCLKRLKYIVIIIEALRKNGQRMRICVRAQNGFNALQMTDYDFLVNARVADARGGKRTYSNKTKYENYKESQNIYFILQ